MIHYIYIYMSIGLDCSLTWRVYAWTDFYLLCLSYLIQYNRLNTTTTKGTRNIPSIIPAQQFITRRKNISFFFVQFLKTFLDRVLRLWPTHFCCNICYFQQLMIMLLSFSPWSWQSVSELKVRLPPLGGAIVQWTRYIEAKKGRRIPWSKINK
jgi:hypothetical protein